MPLNAADLSPEVRAKLGLSRSAGSSRKRARPSRSEAGLGDVPVRCHGCQEVFPSFDKVGGFQAHADETGHARGDLVL